MTASALDPRIEAASSEREAHGASPTAPSGATAADRVSCRAMSRLALKHDDYPDASKKHLDDAEVLDRAGRSDGCAYHTGYVVECAFKSLLLHEASWDAPAGKHDPVKLRNAEGSVETLGHRIDDLFDALNRVCALATARSAKYVPATLPPKVASTWRASLRYSQPGRVNAVVSKQMLSEAKQIYAQTVGQMRLDGVL